MTQKGQEAGKTNDGKKPTRPAFADALDTAVPSVNVERFAPVRKLDEVVVERGVDLSRQPKIVLVIGRGKTGKTTLLRWMAERALDADRPFLMADIDPTNASFASYFPDVSRPTGHEPTEVKQWLQRFLNYAIETQTTAIIDFGGGDTVLRSLLSEMPALFEAIEGEGVAPVVLYMCGPQPDDLAPIVTLASHGFRPRARALVFNEGIADLGLPRLQAFAEVLRNPAVLAEIKSGSMALWMPRLFAAAAVEARRASFTEARDGLTEASMNLFDRTRVRTWLEGMERRFDGIASWLP